MLWGQPSGCFWGDADDQWLRFVVDALNRNECRISARAFDGTEQNGVAVIDGVALKMKRILETNDAVMVLQYPDPLRANHFVSLVPWGDANWPLRDTYPEDQQALFSEDKTAFRELTLTPPIQYFVLVDDDLDTQLSSFSLDGIIRYWTGIMTPELKTRMTLWVTVETSGSDHTISIYTDDSKAVLLTQGVITGNGTCTLDAQDENIILLGEVDLTYSADFEGTLLVRYPQSFKIYVDSVLTNTIDMDGTRNNVVVMLGPFEAGSHTFKAKMLSDDGELSDYGDTITESIAGPPAPTSNLHYVSGNHTATIVAWTSSTTPSATTNVYDSALDTPPNMDVATNTALSQITLPSIGAAAGVRTIVVDSDLAGMESGARQILEIEYLADGTVATPRPNMPLFSFARFGLANLLKIRYTYSRGDEKVEALKVNLYVTDDPSTFTDFSTPDDEANIDTDVVQQSGLLTMTLPGTEAYYWLVRSGASGSVLSSNLEWQGPVFASADAPPAPGIALRAI